MTSPALRPAREPAAAAVPPLENGDHLDREEFERRFDAMPGLKKAELLEGVVYVPSPVRAKRHSEPHADLVAWIVHFKAYTPGVQALDNASVRLDRKNMPQPDAALRIEPGCGGQSRISDDDYVEGPPELAIEVASSSVSYDLHVKLRVFERQGILEYVVHRVLDASVDWFVLVEGKYQRLEPDAAGVFRSRAVPGLWLDAPALLRGDVPRVLEVLAEGLKTPEHADLVDKLKKP